jgi:hypothetical protein
LRVGTDGCRRARHRRVRRTGAAVLPAPCHHPQPPVLAHDSLSAPVANSWRKELRLAWRRRQPATTAAPACASATMVADPGAPPPDPLPQLLICSIFPFPFPFLIRFHDSSAGCVPLRCSWSDASVRLLAHSLRNHHGQELLFTSSKVESRSKYLFFVALCLYIYYYPMNGCNNIHLIVIHFSGLLMPIVATYHCIACTL